MDIGRLPDKCFYLDCRTQLPDRDLLLGYAITDDALVIGTAGLEEFRAARPHAAFDPEEGRFAALLGQGLDLVLRTDVTGQEAIFVALDDGFWAASNSFALIVSEVARHRQLALYPPAVQGFHLRGGVQIGEQLVSDRTMVEGITVLPAAAELRIDRGTGRASISRRTGCALTDVGGLDYETALLDFAERTAGLLGAVAQHAERLRCQLSGGYDTRTVLALLLAGVGDAAFALHSHPGNPDDFPIASAIAKDLGLTMNAPERGMRTLTDDEVLAVWELSCLGTYLPVYPVFRRRVCPPTLVRLTGDLAADWKFYSRIGQSTVPCAAIAVGIQRDLAERPYAGAVAEDFLATFSAHDIDPAAPEAMDLFYNLTRSRFHCGRHWYRDLGPSRILTPLASSGMVRLDVLAARRGWDRRKVTCDLLLAAQPKLVNYSFDNAVKAFPDALVAASPFAGGVRLQARPFTVYAGAPTAPPAGERFDARRLAGIPQRADKAFRSRLEQIDRGRLQPWFTAADFAAADAEIAAGGSLSHGMRRTTHMFFVAAVLDLIGR